MLPQSLIKKHSVSILVTAIFMFVTAILFWLMVQKCDGKFIYPLDDTYIHMAIAKNMSQNGVWGITRHEFSSSTSSPLWTFLLTTAFYITGVNENIPLMLNIIFGIGFIFVSGNFLNQILLNNKVKFYILTGSMLIIPLSTLVLMGMEHTMHTFFSVAFVAAMLKVFEKKQTRINSILLIALSALLPLTRYEGLFLIFVACMMLIVKKQLSFAIKLGFAAWTPLILYGLWCVQNGWFMLPNSVILKGRLPGFLYERIVTLSSVLSISTILRNKSLIILALGLIITSLIPRLKNGQMLPNSQNTIQLIIGATSFHAAFISGGHFFRYESYLFGLGTLIIGVAHSEWSFLSSLPDKKRHRQKQSQILLVSLLISSIFLMGIRSMRALLLTPQASQNIYHQQYQTARFLSKYYNNATIALNDIGFPAFLTDIKMLDLAGLGSRKPALLKLENKYDIDHLKQWALQEQAQIAIIYDNWFTGIGIPNSWSLAGKWKISKNVVCGSDVVSVYAIDLAMKDKLVKQLQDFSMSLPDSVQTEITSQQQ